MVLHNELSSIFQLAKSRILQAAFRVWLPVESLAFSLRKLNSIGEIRKSKLSFSCFFLYIIKISFCFLSTKNSNKSRSETEPPSLKCLKFEKEIEP